MSEREHASTTDVLIIGTGPAGATAALALSTYGVSNLVVNRYGWTARTPRAHITNQRTMEVIRDLGLEREAVELAAPRELMGENPFVTSLAGEELGRIQTWGNDPDRRADYDKASPTMMCDLPQNLLEPMFVKAAAHRGSKVRFDTEYISHEQDDVGVTVTLRDHVIGQLYTVRCKYLIGADGANSRVVDDLGLPLEGKMGLSGSINMVFEADLTKYVAHRPSVLYWVVQPGSSVGGLGIGVVRMVRPWYKWLAIWGYDVEEGPPKLTNEAATELVHGLIGDDTVPVKIEATSTWTVNDMYAAELSRGRVFCMGDAVHRHPPTNGLGSNTSIQDAYNLAWKLAHVLDGKAHAGLLETYNQERAPVARQIVKRANKSLGDIPPIFGALGLLDAKNPDEMLKNMDSRKDATADGVKRREALQAAIANSNYVYNAHGVEMNMRYASAAVVPDGSPDPGFQRDRELYHEHSSRPGAPVPHARLTRDGHAASTLDLCGRGRFSVLTGVTGEEAWRAAAAEAADEYGLDIAVHAIGPGKPYDDPYGDWMRLRETDEDGALLVRPDFIVGWRAKEGSLAADGNLANAVGKILGLK